MEWRILKSEEKRNFSQLNLESSIQPSREMAKHNDKACKDFRSAHLLNPFQHVDTTGMTMTIALVGDRPVVHF